MLLCLVTILSLAGVQADVLDTTIQTEQNTNQSSRTTQNRIDTLAEQTEDLVADYRQVIRESDTLKVYNSQLEQLVVNQRGEMQSIEEQLGNLESTNKGVMPMLQEMVNMLTEIINSDLPFRKQERLALADGLSNELLRADVTTSEKYRKVIEAYQREIELGREASTYEGALPSTNATVTYLKVGRSLLYYQSLDGETAGWWNPSANEFQPLEDRYTSAINKAIRIAQNKVAPNLVSIPVPAAGE